MNNIIPFHPANTHPIVTNDASSEYPIPEAGTDAQDPSMPIGFALFDDGIYILEENDETLTPTFVCSPIRVDAVCSGNNGKGWGKFIAVRNADGLWQDVHASNVELSGSGTRILNRLIDSGLEIASTKKAKTHLLTLLKQWRPGSRMITVDKLGWATETHDAFALPDGAIGSHAILPIIDGTGVSAHLTCKGSVDEWKGAIGMKCVDNPMIMLAVSLAFSGPLLSILGIASGGLHFRGSSSSGKTTLLKLAASVWGTPRLVTQWRATDNGLESIAPSVNDMLLPLDEIAGISAGHLHKSIYMLGNGTGKSRMLRKAETWRLALISTGEISVAEKFKEEKLNQMDGQEVRLIDIEADAQAFGVFDNLHGLTNGSAFSDEITNAAGKFYGAVGRTFVDYIIADNARLYPAIKKTVRNIQGMAVKGVLGPVSGQISRVAERFVVIGVAGELATNAGITGWDRGIAMRVALWAFHDWYDRKYGEKNDAAAEFVLPLKAFIEANINVLCEVGGAVLSGTMVGWRDSRCIYLPPDVWSSVFPGLTGTAAAKALLAINLLHPGEEKRVMKKAPREIPGRPRLYTVNIENLRQFCVR